MAEMYKRGRIERFIQSLEIQKQAFINQQDQSELADLHRDF
ncbi:hypothetical protein [Ammoniphilus sp. 3BR4]